MFKKIVAMAFFLAIVPLGVYAEDTGKETPLPVESNSSTDPDASYFQGVWVGEWHSWASPSLTQDITITIGKKIGNNIFEVTYAWGPADWGRGDVFAGEAKTKGKEKKNKFIFKFRDNDGRKFKITLKKYKDNVIKALKEKTGLTGSGQGRGGGGRGITDTYLNRK